MQTQSKNKAIGESPREFFFAGGGEYKPQTVIASSIEEAQEIYEKTKQKVEPLAIKETE